VTIRAVITAGGTREPVDDVRVLTNLSTGRFGAALANVLVQRGVRVVVLASRELARRSDWLDPRVEVVPFGSFDELDSALTAVLERGAPDLLFMAAAVSDYRPVRTVGKISSSAVTRTLELERNPKMLATLRARCGPDTTLVGFKLLSSVPSQQLLEVARRQVDANGLDLCFANDLAELTSGQHPAWLVPARGEPMRVEGDKPTTAAALADHCLSMRGVRPVVDDLDSDRVLAGVPGWSEAVELRGWSLPTLRAPTGVGDHEQAVLDALALAAWQGRWDGGAISIGTPGGRQWLLGPPGTRTEYEQQLRRVQFGLAAHVESLQLTRPRAVQPVLDGADVIGLTAMHDGGVGVWIAADERRRGRGDRLSEELDRAGQSVTCHDELALLPWWIERGWKPTSEADGWTRLTPPSRRTDLRQAASICLLDPLRRRVLLGKRMTDPWRGFHAFPGGSIDPGETPLQAALRELQEETGVHLPTTSRPIRAQVVYVASGDGQACYAVNNFVLSVLEPPAPRPTPELQPRWIALEDARQLRPMAAGTRRILRALTAPDPWPVPHPQLPG
jgi:ADP-ribose pyrophosphatase YjhB (NUDIX family)